jgi:hypothetical protein
MTISPKAVYATLAPIIAAALLWQITGDKTYLVSILLGFVSGGAAVLAPPAPGVRQEDVARLAERRALR